MEDRRLDTVIREWLDISKRLSVKGATYDRLLIAWRLLTQDRIAGKLVNQIACQDIQNYVNRLVAGGYSLSTIKKQYNLITAYWKHALANSRVASPIYYSVCLPSEETVSKPAREMEVYSDIEQARLIKAIAASDKPQDLAVLVMLEAGLRVGEALSLRWEDILWSRQALMVRRTLVRLSSEPSTYVQDSPKSKSSKRTIPLSSTLYKYLKLRAAATNATHGYIFAREDDSSIPISYSSLEYHVKRLCEKAGLPYRGMHAFRHTFATNCYHRGCDVKLLSKMLGHADVAVTYNTYIHLFGDALEEMRKVLGNFQ